MEQRLQEAQEAVDRQEKEEKKRIFEAWTHGFDEEGVLFFSNSVLKENQYEKPKGYKTGKLPIPAEHLWEDIFQKIDKKKRGAITEDDIKAVRFTISLSFVCIHNLYQIKRQSEKKKKKEADVSEDDTTVQRERERQNVWFGYSVVRRDTRTKFHMRTGRS